MSYYRIPSYELDSRRRYYKRNPDVLGIFSRETDQRRREGVGKGWTSTQEREHAQNFKPLGADWTYENDGGFLLDFLSGPQSRARSRSSSRGCRHPGDRSKSLPSCSTCKDLESHYDTLHTSPHELAAAAESCMVCELLAKACRDAGAPEEEEVQVMLPMNSEGVVFLMLHVGLGPGGSPRDIPIGIPPLHVRGETSRFDLFRAWLRDCDDHGCAAKGAWLPTRVLDVSDPDIIRLVDGQGDLSQDRLDALGLYRDWRRNDEWRGYGPSEHLFTAGRFVALSHRWRSSDEHNFCTHRCNLAARQAGIRFSDLPKRFQDAVTVTRALGVRCLWIDSICIVQPHHEATAECPDGCGQSDDWEGECGKMSDYFGSAYCTLAATSATNPAVDEGILEPSKLLAARTCVLPGLARNRWDPTEQKPGAFDDFAADVEGSELNKRGWVLQERALS